MIDTVLQFAVLTLLIAHTGIGLTLLQTPGNLLDWLPQHIAKIKNSYIVDLLSCCKCLAGQLAFWNSLWIMYWYNAWQWTGVLAMWVLLVIVLTDQLNRRYGYV